MIMNKNKQLDTMYAENPIGNDDWFYDHPDRQVFEAVYFNPDSNEGGQYVIMTLPYELISDAVEQTNDAQSFFEFLEERASYTELVDVTIENFRTVMENYKAHPADFVGRSQKTMEGIIKTVAKEINDPILIEYLKEFSGGAIDEADASFAFKKESLEKNCKKYEKAFLESTSDAYAIYQLKNEDVTTMLRFASYDRLQKQELEPDPDNYDLVYSGTLNYDGRQTDCLEDLYCKFNIERPDDFTGHSLSVSDIVALKQQGVISYHYVDSIGFKELPAFGDAKNMHTADQQ